MFRPVLAKHTKSFNLVDTLSVGMGFHSYKNLPAYVRRTRNQFCPAEYQDSCTAQRQFVAYL